jgi:hypothetical protein
MAAFGKELEIPGWRWYASAFLILYSIEFWAKITNFTNYNYLLALLMVLTIVSGGGYTSGRHDQKSSRSSCEEMIVHVGKHGAERSTRGCLE